MTIEPADERILRAKYLDWCSAKVADRFLGLTPDQIFDLAHASSLRGPPRAAGADVVSDAGAGASPEVAGESSPAAPSRDSDSGMNVTPPEEGGRPSDPELSYRILVARVTEVLASRLALPSFAEWVARYKEAPEQFDSELLGLWRRDA